MVKIDNASNTSRIGRIVLYLKLWFYQCFYYIAISSIENLHLHALPTLRTVILNCNKIKGFEGLDSLSTLKALVLDNNHITHIPFSSMKGCNSLKNLHLEHNRISVLPRLSNLHNLSALHIGYNRIQVRESINNIENVFIIILLVYV